MTIHQSILYGEQLLRENGVVRPRWNAEQLLILALRQPRSKIYMDLTREVSTSESAAYNRLLRKRSEHYPLSYLEGRHEFFGSEFIVTEDVLIPRPETEEIVHAVLALPLPSQPKIVDLGSGSGNIAVTLGMQIPDAMVVALEKSASAMRVLLRNLRGNVVPIRGDLFRCPFLDASFDVVTSNPPYVEAIQDLPAETRWEPAAALLTENLEQTYSSLLSQSLRMLKPGGYLVFEIGFGQASRIHSLCERARGFRLVEIRNDFREIPRTFVLEKR